MAASDQVSPPIAPLLALPEVDEVAEELLQTVEDDVEPVEDDVVLDEVLVVVDVLVEVEVLVALEVLVDALDPLDEPVEPPLLPSSVDPEDPVVAVAEALEDIDREVAEPVPVVPPLAQPNEALVEPVLAAFAGAVGVPQPTSGTIASHIH